MGPSDKPITRLLHQWRQGDREALDALMPIVYDQLHTLANRCFRAENPGHTLRATAVVHEAFLRLKDTDVSWQDRGHFFSIAARMMRRLLVDHAKSHRREKRNYAANVSLDEAFVVGPEPDPRIFELDNALERLAEFDPRKSEIVEMFFFAGLTAEETAGVLQISPATVRRELKMAKAWLRREMRT